MKKPDKPYKDFPLFPHQCGQWVKKINGKLWYFGVWADPDGALERYRREIQDIRAGRDPRRQAAIATAGSVSLVDLVNAFLTAKETLVTAGRLSQKMFAQYRDACKVLIEHFGRTVHIDQLTPQDFSGLIAAFPKTWGLSMIGGTVGRIRSVFLYAHAMELIDKPVRFGAEFRKPRKSEQRIERSGKIAARGRLHFEAEECLALLDATKSTTMKACILLGLNGGFGNTDCSTLTKTSVDLAKGWIDFPRPKTGIERRVPLWPETCAKLQKMLEQRAMPSQAGLDDRVFLTREGTPLVWDRIDGEGQDQKYVSQNNLTLTFGRLLRKCGLHKAGHNFYSLRRTFETVAGATKDQVAVDLIMGHEDSSMAAVYRQGVDDVRLTAVVEYVRKWLFGTSFMASASVADVESD
jgi:integrase